jgi:biopolymer transport protein ExbD
MRRLLATLTLCLTLLCPVALPVASQSATQTQQDPKVQTVYITRTGKKYHRDGCRYLAASKSAISLTDAKAKGYTACKVGKPPE